tara:strand:- start:2650 stop:3396 length:747 start_codon:yes stop_codon:yes gene_type:complete
MTQKVVKKKTRRVRRKSGKKPYFGKEAHEAIVRYQGSEVIEEKHKIYIDEILPAFSKLAENLIFIHGFAKSPAAYPALKSDCISFLYETLNKFDPSRGTKAFSYFNVVAKNWLIIQSKKSTKNRKRLVSIDDRDSLSSSDAHAIESYKVVSSPDSDMMRKESLENLFSLMKTIKQRLNTDNEIACMDAILTLFTKIDDLDLLNKRAVFVYMRDLSSLNPKQLSVAMSSIRKHYRDLVKNDEFDIFFWE